MKYDKYGINDPTPAKESKFNHKDYPHTFNKSSFLKEWVEKYLDKEPEVIFDVGALDGGDTLRFNSWYPNARIISIEGSPHNFKVMMNKLGVRNNVKVLNYTVSDKVGPGYLQQVTYNATRDNYPQAKFMVMGSIYKLKDKIANGHSLIKTDPVRVYQVTIDEVCKKEKIESIDIMHVDIEGAGYNMLLGMTKVLPKLIFIEKDNEDQFEDKTSTNDDLLNLLNKLGYKIVEELSNDYLFCLT